MTHLLTVLADPGMQRVLLALGSLLIGGLVLSAWRMRHDRMHPRCGCSRCVGTTGDAATDSELLRIAHHIVANDLPEGSYVVATYSDGSLDVVSTDDLDALTTGDLPADMRMEK